MRRLDLDAAKTKLKRAKSEKGRSDVSINRVLSSSADMVLYKTLVRSHQAII